MGPVILGSAAVTLRPRTTGGDKYKPNLMRGPGILGKPGGGEGRRDGIDALGRWFQRFARAQ